MKQLTPLLLLGTLAFTALGASQAVAADSSTIHIIGFSKDGKSLAFEQSGVQDGSGFPFAQIEFVEVKGNTYAAPKISVTLEDDKNNSDEQAARIAARAQAKASLKKLGIVDGNEGMLLVSRLLTDEATLDSKVARFALYPDSKWARFGISLQETKSAPIAECYTDWDAKSLEVDFLTFNQPDSTIPASTEVMQKDTTVPSWRKCAYGYSIASVVVYDPAPNSWGDAKKYKLATFLWVDSEGFEGTNHRAMVVTSEFTYPNQ